MSTKFRGSFDNNWEKNVPIPLESLFQVETTAKFRCHLHRSQCWQQELTQGPELLWVTVTNTSNNNNNNISNCILEPSTAAVASSTSTRSGLRRVLTLYQDIKVTRRFYRYYGNLCYNAAMLSCRDTQGITRFESWELMNCHCYI